MVQGAAMLPLQDKKTALTGGKLAIKLPDQRITDARKP